MTTTHDTRADDIATLTAFHHKLALALAPYGNGIGLSPDHPFHELKKLLAAMGDNIDTLKADPRYNDSRMVARPNARDDRYNDSRPRKTDDPLGEDMGRGARSEPFDDGDVVKRSFEEAIQKRAEERALVSGRTSEKEFVDLLDERREFNKAFSHERDPGAAASPAQAAAWADIEAEANRIIAKSATRLTREKAVTLVLKSNLALARRYYGISDDVVG